MLFQFRFRDVPRCLTENGFESPLVQFGMGRNGKRLFRAVRLSANQFNVAALLTCYDEAEQRKYFDDILAGESFQLRHGRECLFRG